MQLECPRQVHKMAKRKEMTLIGPDKLENYDIAEDPNGSESPSDMVGLSVSNVTANEFFYDEDFAIPFDANLTDGQVAPLDDSLLLYSMTSDGGVSSNQFSGDEATLSPYRTVVELSDSDVDVDQSVMRRVTSSASEGGGSEDYWGTDSSLLRGCGVSVENLDQLGVDVERSGELELDRSSDSLTQEMDCDGPEVRLTTWAEVGMGSTRSLSRKPEVSDTDEIKTSSSSSEESDQYESSRLVTWARLDKGSCHGSLVLDDRFERVLESVDSVETGFMQNSGSQLALATGYDASLVAKDTNFLNGALAVGMTTWRTLVTSDQQSGSSSSSDDIRSNEEDWSNDGGCPSSPKRAESVSSPSSKDDGYDSVTKDLSMNDESQSIQDSDEDQDQCDEDQQHLLEGSARGADSVESTMYPGVELPEILRQALAESRLQCSSISTTGGDSDSRRGAVPYHPLDSSLVDLQSVEDQQRSVETPNAALHGRRVQDEKNTRTSESMDSLNASISSSCQQSAVVPASPFTDTSAAASLWSSSDADTKLFSSTDERQGQLQLQGAHTLPRLSKRLNSEAASSTKSFVFRSLMRPLPDLGFLRKSSTRSDRDDKQNLRICSERKTELGDTRREEQPSLNSGYLRPHQTAIESDMNVESSRRKESLLETVNRGTSSRFCPTLTRTRSRTSDSAFSEHSSTSSGIDPGIVDLDDGYGTWNHRKSTLKMQNHLTEPWSSITQEMPHEAKRSCKEFGVDCGESRDVNRKTERLVVKLCNACNIRTVHLEKENQPSQHSLLFSADRNTENPLTSPPKIIVSSADKTNDKDFAFNMVDLSETSRFVNIALDTGKIGNSNIIKLHSISHKEHTDTMSNAFDTVKSQDSRTLCQRNLEKCLSSEDNIEANIWSKVSGHTILEALVNHDSKSDADGKKKRQQQLSNCSAIIREEEVNEQCANINAPKTVYVEFDREKDNSLKRMERQGYKRGKEIQIVPRANKNVSILENGVRFRPGFTPSEAASQCTASNAVGVDSDDRKKLQTDVTAGFLKSSTNYSDQVASSPVDDQPPIDFLVSPDIDSILEGRPSSMKKTDLLLNVRISVESLLHHFNRNRDLQVQCGSTQHDRKVGHLVLDQLCPALRAILLDGLKPDVQGLFGTVRNSIRQVIEDSATMGRSPNLVGDLVTSLKRLKFLNTPSLFFNAFVFALLNCKALDFWLSYVHRQASLLQKHYTPDSFLRLSDSSANRAFQDLVSFLQPLALVPFRLEYNFEVRLLEGRLEEGDRARHALEGHPETTDTYPGLNETQEKFSNTRLLVNSRKMEEKRSSLGNAELVLSESSDEAQRNSWAIESNDEFELNRQTHCALKSHREGDNEVGSSRQPPSSSPEAGDARVIPSVDPTRTEPRVIAINHGAKYSPSGCRNYQRNVEVLSPLRPDLQIIYNEQEEQASRRGADSSVVLTQHSNYSATRNLWSDYKQRIGVVKNRLEKLVFGTS